MAILNILEFPDPRLRTIAKPVDVVDDGIRQLVDDMFETMYEAPGIGLAATQVNVHKRVVVMDLSEDRSEPRVFINPEFEPLTDQMDQYQEGCLSVPGFYENVDRPQKVRIKALDRDGKQIEQGRITKVLAFRGLKRQPIDDGVEAGDIVAIAGMSKATVADTLCALEVTEALPSLPIDPPTISMTVGVNDSPLAGREGDKVQSRVIRDRLLKEAEANVAIRITQTPGSDAYEVAGRGELQLGVLIENMRREGFELSISRPRVVYQTDENGQKLEPIEDVMIDVDEEFSGVVIEKLSARKAEMTDMGPSGAGKTRIQLKCPSRSLIGYQGEFLTDTRGSGVLNRVFSHYEPHKGPIEGRLKGVLVSNSDGDTAAFALWNLEDRGVMFVGAGEKTYQGMIIGENSRWDDLDVNPIKGKQLTNVRASGKDEAVRLTPPRKMSLEQAIAYIEEDELVEVTPKSIRLRKEILNPSFRKKRVRAD